MTSTPTTIQRHQRIRPCSTRGLWWSPRYRRRWQTTCCRRRLAHAQRGDARWLCGRGGGEAEAQAPRELLAASMALRAVCTGSVGQAQPGAASIPATGGRSLRGSAGGAHQGDRALCRDRLPAPAGGARRIAGAGAGGECVCLRAGGEASGLDGSSYLGHLTCAVPLRAASSLPPPVWWGGSATCPSTRSMLTLTIHAFDANAAVLRLGARVIRF